MKTNAVIPDIYMKKLIAVTNRRLITDSSCDSITAFLNQIEKIGHMNPHAIILREKDLSESDYENLAKDVLKLTDSLGLTCILHSYPDAAVRLGCRRIHLPLESLKSVADNDYTTSGGNKLQAHFDIIGASVHSVQDAVLAEKLGASYLTAGHIYATDCKKGIPPRGTAFLKDVCEAVHIPVYAIGGIHFDTAQLDEVISCGAAGACIMSGFMTI